MEIDDIEAWRLNRESRDALGEAYCHALDVMQERCEKDGLNFRVEVMKLVLRWLRERG